MSAFFTRERFGQPQFLAGLLLLAFLAQCLWLTHRALQRQGVSETELYRIQQGLRQWHGNGIAGTPFCANPGAEASPPSAALPGEFSNASSYDAYHSPLWYLIASAPLLIWPQPLQTQSAADWGWLTRAPYLVFGLLLGASLWYVSRRLYGNMGGYIALTLFCFSPAIIRGAALWFAQPEMGAAWGAFGAIFTAIAVAHTLYAPREVILWNWRRIGLLGLSMALAVGSQFSLIVLIPVALAFMLYVAHTRRGAAVTIWAAACGAAALLLFAAYFFHPAAFRDSLKQATFFGLSGHAFRMSIAYRQLVEQLLQNSPALAIAFPASLVAYLLWPRARYFGNHAPLLVSVLLLGFAVGTPHHPGLGFQFVVLPFLFVFVSGISADLLETRQRALVSACVWGLLIAQAALNLWELARI
jgi:hypothetical protein